MTEEKLISGVWLHGCKKQWPSHEEIQITPLQMVNKPAPSHEML
jgi:hypothetical protein